MTTIPEKVQQAYDSLPCGWRLEKLKFFSNVRNSNVDKNVVDDEEPVRLCNYTDVYYNDRITPDLDFMQGSATEDEIKKFQLKRGQVIITKDSEGWDDIGIPALVTENMPDILCGYHLSVLEPGRELDGGFLAWLCRSEPLNDQFKLGANGVTRYGLGQYPMKNAFIAIPPLTTQRQIARFLDEKTAQIDGLIEKKRALLGRLAEKRQALITRAVTKGLNPNAPMKPSGIDWLGDIPAHWELVSFKWRCRVQSGQVDPRKLEYADMPLIAPDHIESGTGRLYQVTSAEEQGAISGKYLCPVGSVLYSKIRPALRKVALYDAECLCSADMYAIDPGAHFNREYLFHFLLTDAFTSYAELESLRVAMPKVNREALGAFPLPMPSRKEQAQIAAYCQDSDQKHRQAGDQIKASIEMLEEYRAALITAAVTGEKGDINGY
ncbi:restriction endonuclease subunit S [Pectobacterium actinidiae]|uniref:Restriction endonuclease subunit S n=1 Tax=Pectobacterium actinidiae TaxID=1507808 RepID=A0ABW8G9S0_9GAMM